MTQPAHYIDIRQSAVGGFTQVDWRVVDTDGTCQLRARITQRPDGTRTLTQQSAIADISPQMARLFAEALIAAADAADSQEDISVAGSEL